MGSACSGTCCGCYVGRRYAQGMVELLPFLAVVWNAFVLLVVLVSIAVLQRKTKRMRAQLDEHELRISGQEQISDRATAERRALQAQLGRQRG